MIKLLLEPRAVREYKKLPRDVARKIKNVMIGEFVTDPFSPFLNVKKLKTPLVGYRLRIGDYRILFLIDGKIIRVYSIRHRKDAYK